MLNVLLVGRPRVGKTLWAMRTAANAGYPILANDPAGEWKQRPLTLREFIDAVELRKGTPTTVIWEEATGYLNNVGGSSKDLQRVVRALTQRFHYKHMNVLVFHSLRAVPVWVMDYCDHLVLFKTADRPSLITSKFKGWNTVLDAHARVLGHPNFHHFEKVAIFGA